MAARALLLRLGISGAAAQRALAAADAPLDAAARDFLAAFAAASPFRLAEPAAAISLATAALAALVAERRAGSMPRTSSSPAHAVLSLFSHHFITLDGEEFDSGILAKAVKAGGYGSVLTGLHAFADGRHVFLHKSMGARRTLEVLGFSRADERTFRELDLKDKAIARVFLRAKIAATGWTAEEAEKRLWANEACAAMVRTRQECLQSEQGRLLGTMPLLVRSTLPVKPSGGPAGAVPGSEGSRSANPLSPATPFRPLAGLKILDLSRILAGPHASKLLASLGAEVLKLSSPTVPDIDAFVLDTSLGKRSAFLDLKKDADRRVFFEEILPETDVIIQGYRLGALDRLGLGFPALAFRINEMIVSGRRPRSRPLYYLSENCFGPSGPLSHLGGWEQIAQCFTGLAMPSGAETPRMLPTTVLDLMTGEVLAMGLLAALATNDGGEHVMLETSLCQTAFYVLSFGMQEGSTGVGIPAQLSDPGMDVASLAPVLLSHLAPQVDELCAANPGWWGTHGRCARGKLGFLRPPFGFVAEGGQVVCGAWRWSTRKNGHDEARWTREGEEGDGDRENGREGRMRAGLKSRSRM
ncbi:CoA-transferase family III domain-containing protein [Hyaloraphidium curvatum]|nr:CoA-transferase family III domain-containing protein [Hyaloraphidium curvatum]